MTIALVRYFLVVRHDDVRLIGIKTVENGAITLAVLVPLAMTLLFQVRPLS